MLHSPSPDGTRKDESISTQMVTITGDPCRVSGVERQISAQQGRHADRVALFDRIRALYDADVTIRDIAQELDLGLHPYGTGQPASWLAPAIPMRARDGQKSQELIGRKRPTEQISLTNQATHFLQRTVMFFGFNTFCDDLDG